MQDYDLRTVSVQPPLARFDEFGRVLIDAFTAAGCDVHVATRLPDLFEQAGIGTPDGTDATGRLEPLARESELAR